MDYRLKIRGYWNWLSLSNKVIDVNIWWGHYSIPPHKLTILQTSSEFRRHRFIDSIHTMKKNMNKLNLKQDSYKRKMTQILQYIRNSVDKSHRGMTVEEKLILCIFSSGEKGEKFSQSQKSLQRKWNNFRW